MLDDLHVVLQAAFGWTDSHLHRFGAGSSIWDRGTELYLCPFDVDEGEDDGVPENQVRLDEVLVDVGDSLLYVYDYGDNWEHRIRLEAVSDRAAGLPVVTCVGGRRAGPPEDCGGIYGYDEMLANAADPASEEHADAVESMAYYGGETALEPSHVDLDEVNSALGAAMDGALRSAYHSVKIAGLLRAVRGRRSATDLLDAVRAARLDQAVVVDAETAAEMMQRFTWLLNRVGDEGIKLTAAGYLPPTHVEAAMGELDLDDGWYGDANRESSALPVLDLREATQRLGLVRKLRDRLLLTKQGQRMRDDPLALWWHIATRLPGHKPDSSEFQSGVVALALVAAGHNPQAVSSRVLIADLLNDLGWRLSTGEPISELSAYDAVRDTMSTLEHAGVLSRDVKAARSAAPMAAGRALVRAALAAGH